MEYRALGDTGLTVSAIGFGCWEMGNPGYGNTEDHEVIAAVHRATSAVPVVFLAIADPVSAGFVTNLARPGANITGFSTFEPEIGGNAELDVGVRTLKARQSRRQPPRDVRRNRRNSQPRAFTPIDAGHRAANLRECPAHACGKPLAVCREHDAPRMAHEQRNPQLLLECRDAMADRARGDAELDRRILEAAEARGRLERAQGCPGKDVEVAQADHWVQMN